MKYRSQKNRNSFFIKFVEIPVWSGVFLSSKSFVASRISNLVRILSVNLNLLGFCTVRASGDLFEGFKLQTVFSAISVKNLLKWPAIERGSSVSTPFIVNLEIKLLFTEFLWIAENKIFQVLRRFF